MSFSASWLALREPADFRARDSALAWTMAGHMRGKEVVRVIDLGCGTGANLRGTAPKLGPAQEWTLVDHDPALLEEAAAALRRWAHEARAIGDQLVLIRDNKQIGVTFRVADLNRDLEDMLAAKPDLVTASALFDLISEGWMKRFATALATSNAAFYTVLTYDGRDAFLPNHPLDSAIVSAFATHQRRDKGFGPAAGPRAAATLVRVLRSAGYTVDTADSPWMIEQEDHALAQELLAGVANAVRETAILSDAQIAEWLAFRQKAATQFGAQIITGHTDILAKMA